MVDELLMNWLLNFHTSDLYVPWWMDDVMTDD